MAFLSTITEQRVRHALQLLSRHGRIRAAYLFGSQIEETNDRWSDIDLAVFLEGLETWSIRERARTAALIQKEAGDDIELHFFPAQVVDAPPPASFAAFIIHHGVPVLPEEE